MTRVLDQLLAMLAPPACASCRAPTRPGERVCPACTRALPWLRRACPRCALPDHGGRPCPASAAAFPRAWAPMAYEGVARDLVAALKFRGALAVADVMAAHMAANLPPDLRGAAALPAPDDVADRLGRTSEAASADVTVPSGRTSQATASADVAVRSGRAAEAAAQLAVIVPVPTVSVRRRRRGFDPAGTLAAALARRLDRPLVACLERRDHASRQVGMSRKARRAPGRLEFAAHAPPLFVLLIDDVHTTGATLDAAARTLAVAGTTVVAALSYARTLTPSGRGRPR